MASGGVIKMQAAGKVDFARYRELARSLEDSPKENGTRFSRGEELKELEQIENTATKFGW
jgi:hypothetical protein